MKKVFKMLVFVVLIVAAIAAYIMPAYFGVSADHGTVVKPVTDHMVECPEIWAQAEYEIDYGLNYEGTFEDWYRVIFTDVNENSFEVSYKLLGMYGEGLCIKLIPKMAESVVVEPTPTQPPYVAPVPRPTKPPYVAPAPRPTKRPVSTPKPTRVLGATCWDGAGPTCHCHDSSSNGVVASFCHDTD